MLSSLTMQKGLTETLRPPRYNPDFIFPDKLSPYYGVLKTKQRELMVGGPAGTAKTHHCVLKAHKLACNYPNSTGVFVRKVKDSLKRTVVPTYYDILGYNPMEAKGEFVRGYGNTRPEEFRYQNGSIIYLVGMNDPKQLDSLQTDWFFANQAEELEEDDWQIMVTRSRGTKMPYRIVFGDCNPSYPEHFLCPYPDNPYRRDRVHYIPTKHEHNPKFYWDDDWTEFGREYVLDDLESLTGLNYDRYRLGLWRAPEGAVFHLEKCHIIPQLPWEREKSDPKYEPFDSFNMYRGMDFGMYPSPEVCIWIAEHKMTKDVIVAKEWRRLKTDTIEMAAAVKRLDFSDKVEATIIDNDENIQSILRKCGIPAVLAKKGPDSIKIGLDLITDKLRNAKEGRPDGLYFYSNLEAGRDMTLEEEKRPTSIIQEARLLVWDLESINPKPLGERHGIDPLRYYYLWRESAPDMPFFGEVIRRNRPKARI